MNPVYLDHHATTPCDPRVVEAMLPYFMEHFGNAGSRQHRWGLRASVAVDVAREQVAAALGATPEEVVWTSGATESNNLALLGVARAGRDQGRHLVTCATEHKAVLDPLRALEAEGFAVTVLTPGPDGRVHPDQVVAALRPDTLLVSLMLANNEIGAIHPVAEVARACRDRGVLVHCDASQALGRIPIDVGALHVDLLSVTAHKVYGPKGVGALFVRRGRPRVPIEPLVHGGGQERGLRSGTLPVPLLVGFGQACALAAAELATEAPRVAALRDRLWALVSAAGDVRRTGDPAHTLPGNLHVRVRGCTSAAMLLALRDEVGLSAGSACSAANAAPSHVLTALGLDAREARSALRMGIGRPTTAEDVERAGAAIARMIGQLRADGPVQAASTP